MPGSCHHPPSPNAPAQILVPRRPFSAFCQTIVGQDSNPRAKDDRAVLVLVLVLVLTMKTVHTRSPCSVAAVTLELADG
ncbi:hypothetical protein E4U42_006580 [Claviceps africana]|uniref:Uncharacterized protein n=1 Tax=Claviceps africana TaxID=83212 RepID=A0A8K0J264_9HYPO|nr:hypothetical protein E4U42_006580 [Claviceps africana]